MEPPIRRNREAVLHAFGSAIAITLFTASALAIPTQTLNPHPDGAADISWIQDKTKKPEDTNHFHIPLRTGETITVSNDSSNYGLKSSKGWGAFADWDNDQYRFTDTEVKGDGQNALLNNFAQGYIDPAHPPLYSFDPKVPDAAKPLIAKTFTAWSQAAQAVSAANKSPAGSELKTGISFKPAGSGRGQFEFDFVDGIQSTRTALAEWVCSVDRVGGKITQNMTMAFEKTPSDFVQAPTGYTIRAKNSGAFGVAFSQEVGWSYDKTPAVAATVDLEYTRERDGKVFDDLSAVDPTLMLTTNIGTTIPTSDKINFYKVDFLTIALHETGHILGLQHSADDLSGSIMRASIQKDAAWGGTMQTIDANSAFGAAELYTIPVPEPASAAVLASVFLMMLRRHRGTRHATLPAIPNYFSRHLLTPRRGESTRLF